MSYKESKNGDCPYCNNKGEENILLGLDSNNNYLVICSKCDGKYFIGKNK